MGNKNHSINYIEIPMVDIVKTKKFYNEVFGWEFQDWPGNYISFKSANIDGGFNGAGDLPVNNPGVLIVLYSDNLENTLDKIKSSGGVIRQEIYSFPGGRRFHFLDPNNNELAVWSDK